MTEPQVWTIIAVFTTLMFSMLTVVSTLFVRVVRGEIGKLRAELLGETGALRAEVGGELGALRVQMGGELGALRAELLGETGALRAELRGEIGKLLDRIDTLDRDVQALVKHTFGIDRG